MGRYNFLEEIYKIPDSNSSVSVVDFTAKCSPEQDKGGERLLSLLEDICLVPCFIKSDSYLFTLCIGSCTAPSIISYNRGKHSPHCMACGYVFSV